MTGAKKKEASVEQGIKKIDLSVVLLHEGMQDKRGDIVTTSLTLIDVHDIARSSRTYGVTKTYIAHPSETLRKLTRTLKGHWEDGQGATYNPDRKEALSVIDIATSLDEVIHKIELRAGVPPVLIGSDARDGPNRIGFTELKKLMADDPKPYLLMLGTGWGMSEELLKKCHLMLAPINGPTDYNHLSVRSAAAILLDRLLGI